MVRYRKPKHEILVDPLTWEFEQREPQDGLDRLLDDGIDPFNVVPQPSKAAIGKAKTKRVQQQIPLHAKNLTSLSRAEMAFAVALRLLRLRPTKLQCRALAALSRATPAGILTPEAAVVDNQSPP
jgi:hypothetical protein